jgi:hypothetical protein
VAAPLLPQLLEVRLRLSSVACFPEGGQKVCWMPPPQALIGERPSVAVQMLRELRAAAALKTAPVLGLDGKPKRRYATDYDEQPRGRLHEHA